MTDLENRSNPVPPAPSDKNPFFSLSPSFWHEKKLVLASAWVLIAVGLVAFTFLNHKKPQQAPSPQAAVSAPELPAPEAAPEPFDITLSSSEAEATEAPKLMKVSAEKLPSETPVEKKVEKPFEEKKVEKQISEKPVEKKAEKAVNKPEETASAEKPAGEKIDTPKVKKAEKKASLAEVRKEAKPKANEVKEKADVQQKAQPAKTPPAAEAASVKPKASSADTAEQQAELAREYMLKGDVKQAMIHQHRAVEIQPNNMFYRLNLGIMHDRVSDRDGAATLYRQVIDAYEKKDKTLPKINIDDVRKRLDYISNEE